MARARGTWGFGFVGNDASDKVGLRRTKGGHELVQLLLRKDKGFRSCRSCQVVPVTTRVAGRS